MTDAGAAPVLVSLTDIQGLSWPHLFGNAHPVELEIGVGKGTFLLRRARQYPERNFFGIEWANKICAYAADRMRRGGLANVRLLRTDAQHFIRVLCPRGSLTALHVYHPDPWPKKRHHKRRLFQPLFVNAAVECLAPGARCSVQTDHAGYFEVIRGMLLAHPQLERVEFDDPGFGVTAETIATNFEVKYRREGRAIYQLAVRRRAEAPVAGP